MPTTTAPMTQDQLDELEDNGMVNTETAQIIQNLIDSVEGGDDDGCTWQWLGALDVDQLKATILEDDANEPREWSAAFDWDAIDWTRLYGYLPEICGAGEWRTPPGYDS